MNQSFPQQQVAQMISGYWVSQAIYVAAKLGLADLVNDGPRTAEELAQATVTHAQSLHRLLRALASVGLFVEDDQHRFSLTPLANCLRSDVRGSQRARAITLGEELYRAYGQLLYSVQTGKTSFDKIYGIPFFDYLARHVEQAKLFDETMVGVHGKETGAMLEAYDFSGIQVLADVGGGNGGVLTAVLQKYPRLRGILLDLPGVTDRAWANLQTGGVADRCKVVGGNFFESVAVGADAYLLRHILHDWSDEQSIRILRNIRRSMPDDGRLLVVESVILPGNEPCFGKLLDLTMLAIQGGQERTQEAYETLFEAGGFQLTRVVPTNAEVSVLEGHRSIN